MNIREALIPVNPFTRPGRQRAYTRSVIWHYTGNPGASAANHIIYFGNTLPNENRRILEKVQRGELTQEHADKQIRYASAHAFIDRSETVIIIPLDELAYHASRANPYSIGVELCIEKDGSIHPDTLMRAIEFGAMLAKEWNLQPHSDYLRHYDITGKICPKPWVDDSTAWEQFKKDVKNLMDGKNAVVSLDPGVATTIINTWMKPSWQEAYEAKNTEQCDYIHWLAQQLRAAAGIGAE